tara:strand:- start:210 stop:443 length:234 start_codon:yes stop_codon:yes gene_type:complete
MFSFELILLKGLLPSVKVLTFSGCQLLFLVIAKKAFKLWSNITEIDHEIGLQLTGKSKAGYCFNSTSTASNKAITYD